MKRTFFFFFLVLVPEALVGRHRTAQLQLGAQTWITVVLNGLPWERTEIIPSFLRLHPRTAFRTFADSDGCSISSKGFLPTVVDIMVM